MKVEGPFIHSLHVLKLLCSKIKANLLRGDSVLWKSAKCLWRAGLWGTHRRGAASSDAVVWLSCPQVLRPETPTLTSGFPAFRHLSVAWPLSHCTWTQGGEEPLAATWKSRASFRARWWFSKWMGPHWARCFSWNLSLLPLAEGAALDLSSAAMLVKWVF